jgi:hypothetical protein
VYSEKIARQKNQIQTFQFASDSNALSKTPESDLISPTQRLLISSLTFSLIEFG